jgi:hypothetical protein
VQSFIRWIATILSLSGNALVIAKSPSGFIVWSIANVIWGYDSIKTRNHQQLILWVVYFILNVIGLIQWAG